MKLVVDVVVVKPFFISLFCVLRFFVRAILCLNLTVAAILVRSGGGRRSSAGQKLSNATSFIFSGPRTSSNYFEPRFHESFVMNSLAASPVNGLDVSDNARIHTSRFLG